MAASFYKWLMVGLLGVFHPFYVTVTEINHNAKNKRWKYPANFSWMIRRRPLKNN